MAIKDIWNTRGLLFIHWWVKAIVLGGSSDSEDEFLYRGDITYLCNTLPCLSALIWWKKTVLKQIKWVVYSICLFTATSFCNAAALKGSVLHGNLLLLLPLNSYLSQQIRNLAAQTVIACLRAWKLPKQHNIFNYRAEGRYKCMQEI